MKFKIIPGFPKCVQFLTNDNIIKYESVIITTYRAVKGLITLSYCYFLNVVNISTTIGYYNLYFLYFNISIIHICMYSLGNKVYFMILARKRKAL